MIGNWDYYVALTIPIMVLAVCLYMVYKVTKNKEVKAEGY